MRRLRYNRGFSLMEIIIALALIAVCAVCVLQIFTASARINEQAREKDAAARVAANAIERFMAAEEPEALLTAAGFEKAEIERGSGGAYTLTVYYDGEWQAVEDGKQAEYTLAVRVAEDEKGAANDTEVSTAVGSVVAGRLYDVSATVRDASGKICAEFSSAKYFVYDRGSLQ